MSSLLVVGAQMGKSEGELPFPKENLGVSLTASCLTVFLRPGVKAVSQLFVFVNYHLHFLIY